MKEKILDFLKNEMLCVVSTVSPEGYSESALVAFSENSKLEILIGTSKKSRKFQNIQENPGVSIVFWNDSKGTIQYEGTARLLHGEELDNRKKIHFKKQPQAMQYESNPVNTYFVIEPSWIRLSRSSTDIVGEMRQFS